MSRRGRNGCLGVLVLGAVVLVPFASCGRSAEAPDAGVRAQPSTDPTKPAKPSKRPRPKVTNAPGPVASGRSSLSWVDISAARAVLPSLPVKGRSALTGYSRDAFGAAWSDVNDNGCDTRNDILRRDLRDTTVVDCVVLGGTLRDPYSGQTVPFTRGPVSSLDVQIDHVVALANAWQTGAAGWSGEKRERFANDRRNLLAVSGPLNLQKSDGDAATWLPPRRAFRCTYVAIQIQIKDRYGLWLTPAERQAMDRVLSRC